MSPSNRAQDRRRRRAPRVEGLEPRQLLSITPFLARNGLPSHPPALVASGTGIQALAGGAAGGSGGASSGGQGGVGNATDQGQPTPHELAREHLVAKLVGTYVLGPGRFTGQAAQVLILAEGSSNKTLHVNVQMGITTPRDPVNGTTTADANLSSRNVGSSGSTLDVQANSASNPNALGIPTHFTWQVGPNSGGLYSGATTPLPASNTMDIRLIPGGNVPRGARSAGRAIVIIQGYVNTSGIFDDLAAPGNRAHQP